MHKQLRSRVRSRLGSGRGGAGGGAGWGARMWHVTARGVRRVATKRCRNERRRMKGRAFSLYHKDSSVVFDPLPLQSAKSVFLLLLLFPAEHPPPAPFCCLIIHLICEAPDAQTAAQGWGPGSTRVWQIRFCRDWCRINSSNHNETAEEGRWKQSVKKEGG